MWWKEKRKKKMFKRPNLAPLLTVVQLRGQKEKKYKKKKHKKEPVHGASPLSPQLVDSGREEKKNKK
jgi:hypothetical protein